MKRSPCARRQIVSELAFRGDPAQNPQAGNNDLLVAVKLMLFREQSGALGMPLIEIPVEKIRETPPAEPEAEEQVPAEAEPKKKRRDRKNRNRKT